MKILRRARLKTRKEINLTGLIPRKRVSTSPGDVLKKEFLRPQRLSVARASKQARIPIPELKAILRSQMRLTRVHAKKLAAFTETSQAFWLNLERTYRRSAATQALLKVLRTSQRQMRRGDRGRPMEEVWANLRRRIAEFKRGGKGTIER